MDIIIERDVRDVRDVRDGRQGNGRYAVRFQLELAVHGVTKIYTHVFDSAFHEMTQLV